RRAAIACKFNGLKSANCSCGTALPSSRTSSPPISSPDFGRVARLTGPAGPKCHNLATPHAKPIMRRFLRRPEGVFRGGNGGKSGCDHHGEPVRLGHAPPCRRDVVGARGGP